MAARAPSDYTQWLDGDDVRGGEVVIETLMDNVLDDMEFLLTGAPEMAVCAPFRPHSTSSTSWVEVARWHIMTKDVCDIANAGDEQAYMHCYVWSDGTATPKFRTVTDASVNNDVSYTKAASATPGWSDASHDTLRVKGNNSEDEIVLYFRVDPEGETGTVWIAGYQLKVAS